MDLHLQRGDLGERGGLLCGCRADRDPGPEKSTGPWSHPVPSLVSLRLCSTCYAKRHSADHWLSGRHKAQRATAQYLLAAHTMSPFGRCVTRYRLGVQIRTNLPRVEAKFATPALSSTYINYLIISSISIIN